MHSKPRKAKAVAGFLVSTAATIAILSFANSASAVPLTWTLMDAVFNDGGTAMGTFTYDAGTNVYLNFDISVAGGTVASFPSITYTSGNASFPMGNAEILFGDQNGLGLDSTAA